MHSFVPLSLTYGFAGFAGVSPAWGGKVETQV